MGLLETACKPSLNHADDHQPLFNDVIQNNQLDIREMVV
jgi:hypothetical protein